MRKPKKMCCENFGDWSFRKIDHSESPQQHLKMISSQVILEAKRDDGELRLVPMDQAGQPTYFQIQSTRCLWPTINRNSTWILFSKYDLVPWPCYVDDR